MNDLPESHEQNMERMSLANLTDVAFSVHDARQDIDETYPEAEPAANALIFERLGSIKGRYESALLDAGMDLKIVKEKNPVARDGMGECFKLEICVPDGVKFVDCLRSITPEEVHAEGSAGIGCLIDHIHEQFTNFVVKGDGDGQMEIAGATLAQSAEQFRRLLSRDSGTRAYRLREIDEIEKYGMAITGGYAHEFAELYRTGIDGLGKEPGAEKYAEFPAVSYALNPFKKRWAERLEIIKNGIENPNAREFLKKTIAGLQQLLREIKPRTKNEDYRIAQDEFYDELDTFAKQIEFAERVN